MLNIAGYHCVLTLQSDIFLTVVLVQVGIQGYRVSTCALTTSRSTLYKTHNFDCNYISQSEMHITVIN